MIITILKLNSSKFISYAKIYITRQIYQLSYNTKYLTIKPLILPIICLFIFKLFLFYYSVLLTLNKYQTYTKIETPFTYPLVYNFIKAFIQGSAEKLID